MLNTSNCILAFPDKTLTASFSGGDWHSSLPLTNLATQELSLKARSVGVFLDSTLFTIDLGSIQPLRVLCLLKTNASLNAQVKITISENVDLSSPTYSTGWIDFYPSMYPQGGLPWGHADFWTGGNVVLDDNFPKDFYVVLTDNYAVFGRYIKIEINDQTNTDGYFELARCFLAPGWQPEVNMAYGGSFGWESGSEIMSTVGMRDYYDKRKSRRVANFTIHSPEAVSLSYQFEMQRLLDIHGELFFIWNASAETAVEKMRSFLCTMRELSPIENPYLDNMSNSYKLKEII